MVTIQLPTIHSLCLGIPNLQRLLLEDVEVATWKGSRAGEAREASWMELKSYINSLPYEIQR